MVNRGKKLNLSEQKPQNTMKQWPRIGSKIEYIGANPNFWFTCIVKNAENNLEIGKEYTVAKLHLASSWCGVELEEFGDTEFSLSFFKHEKELTTQEVNNLKFSKHDE
jgi:hypothetical protein